GPGGGGEGTNLNITQSQLQEIERVVGANTVIPIYSKSDQITVGSKQGRASILGLKPDTVQNILVVTDGTFLRGGDGALVGPTLANDFSLKVGSRIKLGSSSDNSTRNVRVVGILQSTGFGAGLSTDRSIVVTDKWYTAAYGGSGEYSQVNVIVGNINQIGTIENNTDKALNRNQKLPAVRITDSGQFLTTITQALGSITSFVTMLGAISLVVAAVSIFNVMIMSVSERVREIGILRSIGTRKSEIRKMFLYEAVIIGLIGAVIGALMSVVSSYLVVTAIVGNTTYFFTPASLAYIPQGMLVGVATCVLSGVYPAWRAANLDPIEALRAE
ncbi:MAG: ABC transporter permease, partial [Methanomicrobiales archaeon]